MRPLISVIVPVYNPGQLLRRCVKSLLEQTYSNLEIILVDDGSTDESWKLCKEFAEKETKITILQKKNGGAASARNRGIDIAKGEYLAFVDADDYVQNIFIEKLYELCQKYECDIAMCGFIWTQSGNYQFEGKMNLNETRVNTPLEMMFRCCNNNKIKECIVCNKLYKKSLFDGVRYPEGMTYEDLAMTHKILYSANAIAECDDEMYAYYMSSGSVTRKKYNILNFRSENKAQDERIVFFNNIGNNQLIRKNLIAVERNRITNYCRGMLFLKENKQECKELRKRFLDTYDDLLKKYRLDCFDWLLFTGFKFFPVFYTHVLYKLFDLYGRLKIKGVHK